MRRSAWGLSTPKEEPAAKCASPDVNPDWWSADSWLDRGRAIHHCNHHCPVKAWCERDREANPHRMGGTVRAGVFYVFTLKEGLRPSSHQPQEMLCPACDRVRREHAVRVLVEALG